MKSIVWRSSANFILFLFCDVLSMLTNNYNRDNDRSEILQYEDMSYGFKNA